MVLYPSVRPIRLQDENSSSLLWERRCKSIQKKIEEILSGDGIAVCVFDADVTAWDEAEKKRLNAMIKKYASNKNVLICDSMPAIEYWFLIHSNP